MVSVAFALPMAAAAVLSKVLDAGALRAGEHAHALAGLEALGSVLHQGDRGSDVETDDDLLAVLTPALRIAAL
jgi:hypothetical protein